MTTIDAIDFFYLSMPNVEDIGDGSQDALLVRVCAGEYEGWGECEASPLVSIASLICPMSHSACKSVSAGVLGQKLEEISDIARISAEVSLSSMDLLQKDHTMSGIEIAMWDLMGHRLQAPVWSLLGDKRSHPKTPYASALFGDTPQQTLEKGRAIRCEGYRAAKFGWGPFGKTSASDDEDQIEAAREGLGDDAVLLVDVGCVWGENVARALEVVDALERCNVLWLEEPFHTGALHAYKQLSLRSGSVKLAGGEGSHNAYMARHMIDHAGVGFIQIDTGRIGGIGPARDVMEYALSRNVTFVNHTFTSHLALSASLQPFAGRSDLSLCEYPVQPKPLAQELTASHIERNSDGSILTPDKPGLGVEVNLEAVRKYLVNTEIRVRGELLYRTPEIQSETSGA